MHFRLAPTPEAAGDARRKLATLRRQIDRESLAYVGMVVSELVAASVAHGAQESIELSVRVVDDHLDGTVEDNGPGTRALARARALQDDSLPLRIVDGLVEDWRIDPDQTRVSFRMAVQPNPEAAGQRPPP